MATTSSSIERTFQQPAEEEEDEYDEEDGEQFNIKTEQTEEDEQEQIEEDDHQTAYFQIEKSERGTDVICNGGFRFYKIQTTKSIWRCERYGSGCPVRARTHSADNTIGKIRPNRYPHAHNHLPRMFNKNKKGKKKIKLMMPHQTEENVPVSGMPMNPNELAASTHPNNESTTNAGRAPQDQNNSTNISKQQIGALYSDCFGEGERYISVIGGGKMATALVNGFIGSGCFTKSNVFICTRSTATAQQWNRQGFPHAFAHDQFYERVKPRGIVLVAVKPQIFPAFLNEMRTNGWFHSGPTQQMLCISIMAGISLINFEGQLRSVGFAGHCARMMPNVNCAISAGTMLLSVENQMPPQFIQLLTALGSSVGSCIRVDESQFNAASAIAGCGPAFIAMTIEAIADGGVLSGLGRELATRLATEMIKGTAQLLSTNSTSDATTSTTMTSPAQLKDQVCSPAGTTIAGVRELERQGVRSAFIEAINASTRRASELSQ